MTASLAYELAAGVRDFAEEWVVVGCHPDALNATAHFIAHHCRERALLLREVEAQLVLTAGSRRMAESAAAVAVVQRARHILGDDQ